MSGGAIASLRRVDAGRLWVPVGILLLVILVHLPTLAQPLVDAHGFRQTQTAFTARIFHEQGIDLLHSQMPVLGPPWEVPFELPLFQAVAAIVMNAGVPDDVAMRATGLLSFVASAGLLYVLMRMVTTPFGAVVALVAYVASPFGLFLSRSALIEYSAVAAVLLFAIAVLRWQESGRGRWWFLALGAGIVAMTVKATTGVFWVLPLSFIVVAFEGAGITRRSRLAAWALGVMCLAAGLAWAGYTDAIKAASPETAGLTSQALFTWNFGTLQQRLDPQAWWAVLRTPVARVGGFVIVLAVPLVLLTSLRTRRRLFWLAIAAALIGPFVALFNLYYIHTYYSAALTPAAAALLGGAAAWLASASTRWARPALVLGSAVFLSTVLIYRSDWQPMYGGVVDEGNVLQLADQIQRETSPDQVVVIIGRDWAPGILYYAHRRGLMLAFSEPTPQRVKDRLDAGDAVYSCPAYGAPGPCVSVKPSAG